MQRKHHRHAGRGRAAFPRARYFAPRGDWEHAHQRSVRDAVSYIDSNYDPLIESGRMRLVEDSGCRIGARRRHASCAPE